MQRKASAAAQERPQVVERVASILRAISAQGPAGARLKDIAIDTGIARPTVHRLLGELAAVDYVAQLPDRRYMVSRVFRIRSVSSIPGKRSRKRHISGGSQ